MKCSTCNKNIVPDEIVSGYGQDSGGNVFCYDCCAVKDKEQMLRDRNAVLYLDDVKHRVSNWPGTLKFDVKAMWVNRHNMDGRITHVRFIGPDNKVWSGKQVGNNSQLCYCKRTKISVGDIYS